MNVVIIAPYFSINGLGKVAANLTKMLSSDNVKIRSIIRFDTEEKYEYKGKADFFSNYSKKSSFDYINFSLFVVKMLKAIKPDYVISIGPSYDLINIAFNGLGYESITSIHNNIDETYSYSYKKLLPLIIKRSKYIVPVSFELENQLSNSFPKYKDKVIHIPNAVDAEWGYEFKENDPCNLLFIGRLTEQKSVWHLISALHLAKRKPKLKILGDGEHLDFLISLVERYQLQEHVTFCGFVGNVSDYIKSSGYLVLTSQFEGFPMVMLESLALGLPIISVNCKTGPREIMKECNVYKSLPGYLLESKAMSYEKYKLLIEEGKFSPLDFELANILDTINMNAYRKHQLSAISLSKQYQFSEVKKQWLELMYEK